MNIFILDENPTIAARYLCDEHLGKVGILESAQIMCSVFHKFSDIKAVPYKPTHQNHPCTKWAAASTSNFEWLLQHALAATYEFQLRTGKSHKTESVITWVCSNRDALNIPKLRQTPFVICMPDEFKTVNPVTSYRNYYNSSKSRFASWKKCNTPPWYHPISQNAKQSV